MMNFIAAAIIMACTVVAVGFGMCFATTKAVDAAARQRRWETLQARNGIMVDDLARENTENPSVWRYMRNYLDLITNVSGLLCVLIGTEEAMQKKDELWEYIRNRDDKVYKSLYNGFIATAFRTAMRFPSPANVKIVKTVYGIARKIYGFN